MYAVVCVYLSLTVCVPDPLTGLLKGGLSVKIELHSFYKSPNPSDVVVAFSEFGLEWTVLKVESTMESTTIVAQTPSLSHSLAFNTSSGNAHKLEVVAYPRRLGAATSSTYGASFW